MPPGHLWRHDQILRQTDEHWYAPIPAFLTGGEAVASDVAWRHLVPIGRDVNGGYWHCLARRDGGGDDRPVYLFDHDGGDVERIADGVDPWVEELLSLPDAP